jgi:ferredoxin
VNCFSDGVKVTVAHQVCGGHGDCVVKAPEVFDFVGDDDVVTVLLPNPREELRASVQTAADCCPTRAISIETSD